jgi:hypothetical protein
MCRAHGCTYWLYEVTADISSTMFVLIHPSKLHNSITLRLRLLQRFDNSVSLRLRLECLCLLTLITQAAIFLSIFLSDVSPGGLPQQEQDIYNNSGMHKHLLKNLRVQVKQLLLSTEDHDVVEALKKAISTRVCYHAQLSVNMPFMQQGS